MNRTLIHGSTDPRLEAAAQEMQETLAFALDAALERLVGPAGEPSPPQAAALFAGALAGVCAFGRGYLGGAANPAGLAKMIGEGAENYLRQLATPAAVQ